MRGALSRLAAIQRSEGTLGVLKAINRYRYHHVASAGAWLSNELYRPGEPPFNPLKEQWDLCIILDACRHDLYTETVGRPVPHRYSPASSTAGFFQSVAGAYGDTVYVTGNPMYRKAGSPGYFFDVVDTWRDGWDQEERTVRPETMAEYTRKAYEAYPDKRILAHWVQPHYPFLTAGLPAQAGFSPAKKMADGAAHAEHQNPTVWTLVEGGAVSREQAWEWYRENLELALDEVNQLVASIKGRVVLTADHGNLVGERIHPLMGRRGYGHPAEIVHEVLRKVPWDVVKDTQRRPLGIDVHAKSHVSGTVEDRLRDLGYTT